jgi:hypothetical protein
MSYVTIAGTQLSDSEIADEKRNKNGHYQQVGGNIQENQPCRDISFIQYSREQTFIIEKVVHYNEHDDAQQDEKSDTDIKIDPFHQVFGTFCQQHPDLFLIESLLI